MDPCNASDLLCVNISGQLFIIECVDFFSINLRGAAVCAMKTLLSCFSHFWASCKMLLHLLCLHCSAALNCTAAQCSKHTSAPGHLTWLLLLLLVHFANFGTFWLRPNSSSILLRWEIWPKFFAPTIFKFLRLSSLPYTMMASVSLIAKTEKMWCNHRWHSTTNKFKSKIAVLKKRNLALIINSFSWT